MQNEKNFAEAYIFYQKYLSKWKGPLSVLPYLFHLIRNRLLERFGAVKGKLSDG